VPFREQAPRLRRILEKYFRQRKDLKQVTARVNMGATLQHLRQSRKYSGDIIFTLGPSARSSIKSFDDLPTSIPLGSWKESKCQWATSSSTYSRTTPQCRKPHKQSDNHSKVACFTN
jgi:hypothetical protein